MAGKAERNDRALIILAMLTAIVLILTWYVWQRRDWDAQTKEAAILAISTVANVFLVSLLVMFNVDLLKVNRDLADSNAKISATNDALHNLAEEDRKRLQAEFQIRRAHANPAGWWDIDLVNSGWKESAVDRCYFQRSQGDVFDAKEYDERAGATNPIGVAVASGGRRAFKALFRDGAGRPPPTGSTGIIYVTPVLGKGDQIRAQFP